MHADNLIINYRSAWKAVESVAKLFPHFYREAPTAFIIKSVDTIDSGTFMVSSQEEEIFRILDFVRE